MLAAGTQNLAGGTYSPLPKPLTGFGGGEGNGGGGNGRGKKGNEVCVCGVSWECDLIKFG